MLKKEIKKENLFPEKVKRMRLFEGRIFNIGGRMRKMKKDTVKNSGGNERK